MIQDPEPSFDFSVLTSRIKEVEEAKIPSQKNLTKAFVKNTIIPILSNPQINEAIKDPQFVNQLTGLFTNFLTTSQKVMSLFDEP